jgi:selenide,water dikinase
MVSVSTTDFFYPLVEDPFKQGEIACCNVLSDLYSMGLTEVDNILMILGVSLQMKEREREIVTREMMRGFNHKAIEAGTSVTGGQSVMNPWPMIGGTAISVAKKSDVIFPNNAKEGDLLILTKPLGTQVVVNLAQWLIESDPKWVQASEFVTEEQVWDAYKLAEKSMSRLNLNGAKIMRKFNIGCCTDVTGFGIKGHAENLVIAQKKQLKFKIDKLPIISFMDQINSKVLNFKLDQGYSAETSGGLLLAIERSQASQFIQETKDLNEWGWIVGEVLPGNREVEVTPNFEYINQ